MDCKHYISRIKRPDWKGDIEICRKCKRVQLPTGKTGDDLTTFELREIVKRMGRK